MYVALDDSDISNTTHVDIILCREEKLSHQNKLVAHSGARASVGNDVMTGRPLTTRAPAQVTRKTECQYVDTKRGKMRTQIEGESCKVSSAEATRTFVAIMFLWQVNRATL